MAAAARAAKAAAAGLLLAPLPDPPLLPCACMMEAAASALAHPAGMDTEGSDASEQWQEGVQKAGCFSLPVAQAAGVAAAAVVSRSARAPTAGFNPKTIVPSTAAGASSAVARRLPRETKRRLVRIVAATSALLYEPTPIRTAGAKAES